MVLINSLLLFKLNEGVVSSVGKVAGRSPKQALFLVSAEGMKKREMERCCIMKSAGYFSYTFHQLLIRSVANLKIIEHEIRVYEVLVSAEVKEVFKLDLISYLFFLLLCDSDVSNSYI